MLEYDVCVFGGGPSGSVIAKRLSELGHNVVLVEKQAFPRWHIGLSLTSGIHHWLELLQVDELVKEKQFHQTLTSYVLWENDEIRKKTFSPERSGYHVDRGEFDQVLLESAKQSGVTILQPCSFNNLKEDESGNWNVTVTHDNQKKQLSAKFIVEATGRKSILKGSKKAYLPNTIATYAFWDQKVQGSEASFIEAGKDEWFWAAPVSKDQYVACIFSDADAIKTYDSVNNFYEEKISQFTLLNLHQNISRPKNYKVVSCSSTAYKDEKPIGTNYIKVGDAAFSLDPISAQGVQKAIKSAYQGAIVVNTILRKEDTATAISYYDQMIDREIQKNKRWTQDFYNQQQRFTEGEFWMKRKNESVSSERQQDVKLSLNKDAVLVINPESKVIQTPIVGEKLITSEEGIVLSTQDEPFVFLDQIHVPTLIQKLNSKSILQILKTIQTFYTQSDPMKVLQWLLYHRILQVRD